MKQQFQQSNNLSSIMIYTGSSYLEAANSLANREYGHYIEDLGYLSLSSDKRSYWSNYKTEELMFADTNVIVSKISDIYGFAYSYQNRYMDNHSSNISINTIRNNDKSISRYHAEYSYQNDLNNDFSNIVEYTANDLKNFLFALNYQKFNKTSFYGKNNEVSSIRIGAKTFDWHLASDTAYTFVEYEEDTATYYFAYDSNNTYYSDQTELPENVDLVYTYSYTYPKISSYFFAYDPNLTYYYNVEDVPEGQTLSYAYTYDYVKIFEHNISYLYGADNYYAYVRKEYEPIDATLKSSIAYYTNLFEEKYNHNTDLYTYYMYDCVVDVPMLLTTYSAGNKKSVFEMRYNSDYDRWFETGIFAYFNFETQTRGISFSANEDGTFGIRINENENIFDNDITVSENSDADLYIDNTNGEYNKETEFTILSPNNMKYLEFINPAGVLNLTKTGWTNKGNNLEELVITNNEGSDKLDKILGINDLTNLEKIVLNNCNNLKSTPSISNLTKLEWFDATNSNIQSFKPAEGTSFEYVSLPVGDSLNTIRLKNVEFVEDSDFIISNYSVLNSLTFDNVSGIDTFEYVNEWNETLKNNGSLIPQSIIRLELNNFDWENVPVDTMKDIKKFDLSVENGNVSLVGHGNYGMLTREEYIDITKMYGVNAFVNNGSEKVFKTLNMTKSINTLQDWEYTFKLTSDVTNNEYTALFNYSEAFNALDNSNSLIAVNAIVGKILENNTMKFIYDEQEKSIYFKLQNVIDTKDTPTTNGEISVGDIVLYNGDTIKIFFNSISAANNKFNYIKLGKISNNDANGINSQWFKYGTTASADITFTQYSRPEVIENIYAYDNAEITEEVSSIQVVAGESIDIYIDVDNHNATANKISVVSLENTQVLKITPDSTIGQNEWPKKYNIEVNATLANIPVLESKEYKIKVALNEKLTNSFNNASINLSNIVYKEISVVAISNSNQIATISSNNELLILNSHNASIDDQQIITLDVNEGDVEFDENGTIIINDIIE